MSVKLRKHWIGEGISMRLLLVNSSLKNSSGESVIILLIIMKILDSEKDYVLWDYRRLTNNFGKENFGESAIVLYR